MDELVKKSKKGGVDLNDVWDIRKKYDDIVSKTIKQADDTKNPSTILQKDLWLENRKILNDVLERSNDNLGEQVSDSFRKMRLYYEGMQNIQRRAPIDLKGIEGTVTPGKVFKGAATLIGGTAVLKFLFGE